MKIKMIILLIILLIVSMILSLITIIFQSETNRFGFPINFLFYKGGHYESLSARLEILSWENLRVSSFRVDLYVRNSLYIWCIIASITLITNYLISKAKSSK